MTSKTDPKGNKTTYEVNLNNRVTKMILPNESVYSYDYDKAGRIRQIESPLGYKKTFGYDKADNIIKEADSMEQVTTYRYDKLHRMTESTNAEGGKSSFAYDVRGNMTSETDPLGRSNTYTYNLASQMVQAVNPLGQLTEYTYDPVGNLTALTEPGGRKTAYSYDKNYNVKSVTDPLGYVTSFSYDKNNRLKKVKDTLEQTEGYKYDKNGRLTKETDKAGNSTGYTYDPHGNILSLTDKAGLKTNFEYDDNDNLTRVTDALGEKTSYGYDQMDQRVSYTNALGYEYDKDGNLISENGKDKKQALTYEHTAENRLRAVSGTKEVLMAATYDGDGNRIFQLDHVEDGNKTNKGNVLIPESAKTKEGDSALEELVQILPKGSKDRDYTITQYVNDINQEHAQTLLELKTDGRVQTAYTYGTDRLGRDEDINYYGYNAESTNTNTGFQYLRARHYNPQNGNFTTEDRKFHLVRYPKYDKIISLINDTSFAHHRCSLYILTYGVRPPEGHASRYALEYTKGIRSSGQIGYVSNTSILARKVRYRRKAYSCLTLETVKSLSIK